MVYCRDIAKVVICWWLIFLHIVPQQMCELKTVHWQTFASVSPVQWSLRFVMIYEVLVSV